MGMIRSGKWKLCYGHGAPPEIELYDLEADPLEMRNLLVSRDEPEKNREQAKEMKARLGQWLRRHEPHKVKDLAQRKLF